MLFGNEITKEFVLDDIFGNSVCIHSPANHVIANYDCWIDSHIHVSYNNPIILTSDDLKTLVI